MISLWASRGKSGKTLTKRVHLPLNLISGSKEECNLPKTSLWASRCKGEKTLKYIVTWPSCERQEVKMRKLSKKILYFALDLIIIPVIFFRDFQNLPFLKIFIIPSIFFNEFFLSYPHSLIQARIYPFYSCSKQGYSFSTYPSFLFLLKPAFFLLILFYSYLKQNYFSFSNKMNLSLSGEKTYININKDNFNHI